MTIIGSGLRDLEYAKFNYIGGSVVAVNVNLLSGITVNIGSVSAWVDDVYVASGTINSNLYGKSGTGYYAIHCQSGTDSYLGTFSSGTNTILGSAYITNPAECGSWTGVVNGSVSQNTSPWVVSGTADVKQVTSPWVVSGTATCAGSIYATGSININTTLSEIGSWTGITNGSQLIMNPAMCGSFTAMSLGSVLVSNPSDIGSWTSLALGSSYITNPSEIGSFTSMVLGSTLIMNSLPAIGSYTSMALGSSYITNPEAIGSFTSMLTGSSYCIQGTNPWVVSGINLNVGSLTVDVGSIYIATTLSEIGSWTGMTNGSAYISNPLQDIGSFTSMSLGSVLVSNPAMCGSWTNMFLGSVEVSNPVACGSYAVQTIIGSVYLATPAAEIGSFTSMALGSSYISNFADLGTQKVRMSASAYGNTVNNTAGSYQVLIPTTGSKLVITDWVISSQAANNVFLFESGITPFATFYFAANGGCVNNLNTAIKLANVGSQLWIGQGTGSVAITAAGYSEA